MMDAQMAAEEIAKERNPEGSQTSLPAAETEFFEADEPMPEEEVVAEDDSSDDNESAT